MEEEAAEYLQKYNVQKKPVVGFIACVFQFQLLMSGRRRDASLSLVRKLIMQFCPRNAQWPHCPSGSSQYVPLRFSFRSAFRTSLL